MSKIIISRTITFLAALAAFMVVGAYHADTAFASGVSITVVIPDEAREPQSEPAAAPEPLPTPAPEPTATPVTLYPVDVTETRDGGGRQIVKTYELADYENPADIPRADFERVDGISGARWLFTLTDVVRRETSNAETREHKETVTITTDTKEIEKILPLLPPTMDYKAEDGFTGVLLLDVSSIKVEASGTKTTSYELKTTREYPRLSAADTSLIPKTVTENGKAYNLAGVDWQEGNAAAVDYDAQPEYYTAIRMNNKKVKSAEKKDYSKELIKLIKQAAYNRAVYQVFNDFLETSAISLSNVFDFIHRAEREKRYLEIIGMYAEREAKLFPEMLAYLVEALDEKATTVGPEDVLGPIFHELNLHNEYRGQFFTPQNVSDMMAFMVCGSERQSAIKDYGYFGMCEPTCGSGVMVTSMCKAMLKEKMNYCTQLLVVANDVDLKCAHMTYIQLALYGVPAVVIHGDSLLLKEWSRWYTPIYLTNDWVWRGHCGLTDASHIDEEMFKCASVPSYALLHKALNLTREDASSRDVYRRWTTDDCIG